MAGTDTRSTLLQLLIMGDGLHNGDWGDQTSTNLVALESAIAATDAIALTGTTLALSQAQNANAVLSFSGTLTGAFTLTVQPTSKWWIVKNATSGAFTLTITTGSGATVVVPQGQTLIVYCDGTNVYDVVNSAIPQLTSGTVLANTGSGPAATSYSALLTALGLNTTQTPVFGGVNVNAAAATLRSILFSTAAALRWVFGANATAEGGANAGSDFSLDAYADNGSTLIGHALIVTRSTLAALWNGSLNVIGALTNNGTQVRLGTVSGVINGRLTLVSATPVMTVTESAQGTVFFTPLDGNVMPGWNGSTFVDVSFTEVSQALTDTTKSPAAATTNSNYDYFWWLDGSTWRCTRGPAWSSGTARGTGAGTTQLTRVNGFLVNQFAITNGPGAGAGLFVGSIRTNGSSLVDWIYGGSSPGGTAGSFGVWNMFNRRNVASQVIDTSSTWNYSTTSFRSANNSAGNRISAILGLAEDVVNVQYMSAADNGNASFVGVGLDSTSLAAGSSGTASFGSANFSIPLFGTYAGVPGIGFHFFQAIEQGNTSTQFVGGGASALTAQLRM